MSAEETTLALAVIALALEDAVCADPRHSDRSQATRPTPEDVAESRSFLLDIFGGWYQSRIDVCQLAGICPDALRNRAYALITGATTRQPHPDNAMTNEVRA